MKKITKRILLAGTALTATAAAATSALNLLHNIAAGRNLPPLKVVKKAQEEVTEPLSKFSDSIQSGQRWLLRQPSEEVFITSFDGLRLCGHLFLCENAKRTILMLHGFRSSWARDFGFAARDFYEAGCNLLIVEQRSHGKSEGNHITYGVLERFDCRDWLHYLHQRFGDLPAYADGVSMGASTVLMATGLELPKNVRGVIADCGFTSPKAIISRVFSQHSPVPSAPIVSSVSLYSKLAAGFSFSDYSTLEAMEVNTLPVFFAHGSDDNFVPLYMTLENYNACKAPKKLLISPGAGHGLSYLVSYDRYRSMLLEFFEECEASSGAAFELE